MPKSLRDFIKESNRIEGITSYSEDLQYDIYESFFDLEEITVAHVEDFALCLFGTTFEGTDPKVRRKEGMDVRVGNHRPIPGGPKLEAHFTQLLFDISKQTDSSNAYILHCEYEKLHPLMDCNGRTGRAIWAWLMLKDGYDFELGFLHKWYYQSLDNSRG